MNTFFAIARFSLSLGEYFRNFVADKKYWRMLCMLSREEIEHTHTHNVVHSEKKNVEKPEKESKTWIWSHVRILSRSSTKLNDKQIKELKGNEWKRNKE